MTVLRIARIFLLSAAVRIFPSICIAQSPVNYYRVSRITPDDGLSQGSNYFRYEDSRGFMWLTANDALNRWDGAYVKVYNLARYFIDCPPLQQGYGFSEDDSGNIYIGSVRGLYRYDRLRDRFTLHRVYPEGGEATAMPFAVKDGKVWCFNRKYEVAVYDPATGNAALPVALPLPPLPTIHIYELEGNIFYNRWPFFDAAGDIWFVTQKQILRYNPQTGKTRQVAFPTAFGHEILCNSSQYYAPAGLLHIASNIGLLTLHLATGQWRRTTRFGQMAFPGLVDAAQFGALFLLTDHYRVVFTDTAFTTVMPASIQTITNRRGHFSWDKAGRAWMCDDGAGAVIYDFRRPLMQVMPDAKGAFASMREFGAGRFVEAPSGNIIIGGYAVLHPATGTQLPDITEHFSFNTSAVADRKRKGMWIWGCATLSGPLQLYFLDSNNKRYRQPLSRQDAALRNFQSALILDDGRMLCAIGSGLYWYDEAAHHFSVVPGQPQNNVFYLSALSRQRVAISYLNKDMWLAQYEPGGKLRFVKRMLPGVQAFYVAEDTVRGQYWVGTNQGIYLLDKDFGIIRKWDAAVGLAGTNIYGILIDDAGSVWASHQRGLSAISLTSHHVSNYTPEDGVQGWDFNNRAFLKASDGTLYFGGVNGFNYFMPPLHRPDYYRPRIYLDEILVNDARFRPDTAADAIGYMDLRPSENKIVVHAVICDLDGAQGQQLAYRLNGKAWTRVAANSVISFAALSEGSYTLDLAVYDKLANRTTIQKTLRFDIATPLYRNPWVLILLGVVSTAGFFYRMARRRLARQGRAYDERMALVRERQRITADLHDDIGASLSSLQVNSAVARQLIDKDLSAARRVLEKIEDQARALADKVGDIIWSMKPGKDEFMSVGTRIKNFAHDMLSATDILYEVHADKAADGAVTNILLRKNVVYIAKEAINNAAKYSGATTLFVQLTVEQQWLSLIVRDNGKGLTDQGRQGNGIQNMRRRTEESGGTFTITSTPAEGTEVKALIPLVP